MYLSYAYWHDPCQAASQTARRLQTPLQYHLRRHDYVAFQKELTSGTNPFIRDECGRTPLDLALIMLEDLIITSLCTSFPVDFLVKTLDYDARFPAKFVPHYANAYANLYDHPNALRLAKTQEGGINAPHLPGFGTGAPSEYPRFFPASFPMYKHDVLPNHIYDKLVEPAIDVNPPRSRKRVNGRDGREVQERGRSEGQQTENLEQQEEEETESQSTSSGEDDEYPIEPTAGPLRPPHASKLQKLFQDQMVVVVEDAIQHPTPAKVKKRMHEILSQMRALCRAINLLMTCEPLRVLAVEYRLAISRHSHGPESRLAKFILENLTYPYLFMATLQNLFEMYPYNPSQTLWNIHDVADARRLINLVLFKKLKGHEAIFFLSQLPRFICSYIRALGVQFFKPKPEVAQYLMTFAFCMDAPDLFYFACRAGQPFSCGDFFPWDKLISELVPHKRHFYRFLIPLITSRLKARVQSRLVSIDADEEIVDDETEPLRRYDTEKIFLPFEERYLTKNFLRDFGQLFGSTDLVGLENMLRWWQYEVVRLKQGDPPSQPPPMHYVTDRDITPPSVPYRSWRKQQAADVSPLPSHQPTVSDAQTTAKSSVKRHFDSRVHHKR